MTRIVSVTERAVQRDTRAFKVGASVARFGYDSIMVEGERSELDRDELPFSLLTLPSVNSMDEAPGEQAPPVTAEDAGESERPRGLIASVGSVLPEAVRRPLRPAAEWLRHITEPLGILITMLRDNLRVMRDLPKGQVYYLHSFWYFPAAYVRSKRSGTRVVYDAHDANWVPDPTLEEHVNRATLRMLERLDRICARRVTAFLTVGSGLAGLLEERLGRRPVVLRNGHDFRIDEPAPEHIREAAGVSDDAFLLVMTGAAKTGDTVEVALEALERLPDGVHLALVGRDHESRRPLIEAHGLGDRVHLLPPVPPTQVASFIRTADASPILYRALSEAYAHSLPNRFFHAVAAGLPILYPPLHEIKALCEEHDLGIEIDPTDPASIEAGVRTLSEDPKLAARYAANAERARPLLSWEHEEPILADALERTLHGDEERR